jgi:PilZ domain
MPDDEAGNRDSSSEASRTEQRQSEHRRHSRFPFMPSVHVIEPQSHAKLSARTSDLGPGGCYVDTMNPFAVGTVIKVRFKKEVTFEAHARLVFSQVGMGMRVAFISAVPWQLQIFQKWLKELTGKSLPELEPPEETEAEAVVANSTKHPDSVLGELLTSWLRGGTSSRLQLRSSEFAVVSSAMVPSFLGFLVAHH